MAAINDLLRQIPDRALRERLEQEFARLSKNKKFGLVFEEHIPECTPLYDIPVVNGRTVAKKADRIDNIYTVLKLNGETAVCLHKTTSEVKEIALNELVPIAQFGEPIFPSLNPITRVETAPGDSLWHTLIEADNFHALQLLEYLYPKQVDCIYIDPPYNTGEDEWKYNDVYIDTNDNWRHSKWLSLMQKRLRIAKRILSENGVLIISIGYHELNRLALLCDELFPDKQVVSVTVQTSGGKPKGGFNYVQEYLVFVAPMDFFPNPLAPNEGNKNAPFHGMTLATFDQTQRPNQTYPIFINNAGHIIGCGQSLQDRINKGSYSGDLADFQFNYDEAPDGCVAVWPVSTKGLPCVWRLISTRLMSDWEKGYIKVIPQNRAGRNENQYSIQYLSAGIISKIESGELPIVGHEPDSPTVIIEEYKSEGADIPTIWVNTLFYTTKGSNQIKDLLGIKDFSYPKPIDLMVEIIRRVTKPNSLIVDFFAGSGTTLQAVNLLNEGDTGSRRCILVTNNEVSKSEARRLTQNGHQPGDAEWESRGICQSVTWPRVEYSILGKRSDGTILPGEYITNRTVIQEKSREFIQLGFIEGSDQLTTRKKKQIVALLGKSKLPQSLVRAGSLFVISDKHTSSILFDCAYVDEYLEALEDQEHITEFYIVCREGSLFETIRNRINELLGPVRIAVNQTRPMGDGFHANVEYFKLGFLDKNSVSLGQQFIEILPLLWLKSGAIGKRPEIPAGDIPEMMVLPQNGFAILIEETKFAAFADALGETDNIGTVYFVTNSEEAFREMSAGVKTTFTYQLYRDYIDNFVLGGRRDTI